MVNNLSKRTIQIVGSCFGDTSSEINEFSHELIKYLTLNLLKKNATILGTVGADPSNAEGMRLIYDWDVLESAYEYAESLSFSPETKNIVTIVSSKKSESKIPENKRELWDKLIANSVISVSRIKAGKAWNAGGQQRQEQEKRSEILIILGGGEGAENLYSLYNSHGKTVLPLNIPLGSSFSDGISKKESSGVFLYEKAVDEPKKFIPRADTTTATKLIELDYTKWKSTPQDYANKIIDFLELEIIKPQVFYVKLLNTDYSNYHLVTSFFRDVVDFVVKEKNFHIKDMGFSESEEAFLNLEIFKEINNSSIIIADFTDLRPNCFMEAGFAFGLKKRVILTAKEGTIIPFDSHAIDCLFWDPNPEISFEIKRKEFCEFWKRNINKPNIVPEKDIL